MGSLLQFSILQSSLCTLWFWVLCQSWWWHILETRWLNLQKKNYSNFVHDCTWRRVDLEKLFRFSSLFYLKFLLITLLSCSCTHRSLVTAFGKRTSSLSDLSWMYEEGSSFYWSASQMVSSKLFVSSTLFIYNFLCFFLGWCFWWLFLLPLMQIPWCS